MIFNPDESLLKSLGYKPVTEQPSPEPEDGFYFGVVYSETETEIVQGWEKYPVPLSDLEIVEKILKGEEVDV